MNTTDAYFDDWQERQNAAEAMIPIIGDLHRRLGANVKLFGRTLVQKDAIEILKMHKAARSLLERELSCVDSLTILKQLQTLELAPSRIDLGKLNAATSNLEVGARQSHVEDALSSICGNKNSKPLRPKDVVLYGFGRIGRLLARILVDRTGGGAMFRLRAIVVRPPKAPDLHKRASLLLRDSVHGPFRGYIEVDEKENALVVNGNLIRIIYAQNPEAVDYTQYGIEDAMLIDNTGIWRDEESLGRHLKAKGVGKVLLTAPGKGNVPNIVYGVNDENAMEKGPILSAASCTTNAVVPVLKAVLDQYGIESGHLESCHSYTNDQNLIDNYHAKARRGRGAALNMVLTETGAAKAAEKALPELKGKLTANAIRVPTPNVSMAVLNLQLERETTTLELNAYLKEQSVFGHLQNQIGYIASPEVVSSDFVGALEAGVVDGENTIVRGKKAVVYVWYDNEYGYSRQVVRLMEQLAGIRFPSVP